MLFFSILCVLVSCLFCAYLKNLYFFIFTLAFVLFTALSLFASSKRAAHVIRIIQVTLSSSATTFFAILHLSQQRFVNDYLCLALFCFCALCMSLVANHDPETKQCD